MLAVASVVCYCRPITDMKHNKPRHEFILISREEAWLILKAIEKDECFKARRLMQDIVNRPCHACYITAMKIVNKEFDDG